MPQYHRSVSVSDFMDKILLNTLVSYINYTHAHTCSCLACGEPIHTFQMVLQLNCIVLICNSAHKND